MAAPGAYSQGCAAKELRSLAVLEMLQSRLGVEPGTNGHTACQGARQREDATDADSGLENIFATIGLGVRDSYLQIIVAGGETKASGFSSMARSPAVNGPTQLLSVTITLSQCEHHADAPYGRKRYSAGHAGRSRSGPWLTQS